MLKFTSLFLILILSTNYDISLFGNWEVIKSYTNNELNYNTLDLEETKRVLKNRQQKTKEQIERLFNENAIDRFTDEKMEAILRSLPVINFSFTPNGRYFIALNKDTVTGRFLYAKEMHRLFLTEDKNEQVVDSFSVELSEKQLLLEKLGSPIIIKMVLRKKN